MFSIEAAAVAGAVAERRREFGTVRYCAREALRQIGVPAVPILPDVDGAPRWPVGVVGSMTHCAGYRAAVVARSGELCGVGIDAEPHAALPDAALDLVLRDEERARLLGVGGRLPRPALGSHPVLRQGGGLQGVVPVDPALAGFRGRVDDRAPRRHVPGPPARPGPARRGRRAGRLQRALGGRSRPGRRRRPRSASDDPGQGRRPANGTESGFAEVLAESWASSGCRSTATSSTTSAPTRW